VCKSADGDGEDAQEDEARQRAQEEKKSAAELEKALDQETVEKETAKSHR
jgi:hypothetical protein